MSRFGVRYVLRRYAERARTDAPTLAVKMGPSAHVPPLFRVPDYYRVDSLPALSSGR